MNEENAMQMQQIQQQASQLNERIEVLQEAVQEIDETVQAVEDLEDVEEGEEILARLGSGAFVKAEIKDTENVMTELGGEAVQERTREEAVNALKNRRQTVEEVIDELQEEIDGLKSQVQGLGGENA